MTQLILCDDDCTIEVAVVNAAILLSIVDTEATSTTRLDCQQTRRLAAALIRALQVSCAARLAMVQSEVQP